MGWILVGLIACVGLTVIALFFDEDRWFTLGVACLLVGCAMGVLPWNGYEEMVESEVVELVSLRDDTVSEGGGLLYVSISGENHYSYYTEVETPFATGNSKAYIGNTISGDNIIIVEDDDCSSAKLVTYSAKIKKSFWSYGKGATYRYVFYVPTGTIARNISLG